MSGSEQEDIFQPKAMLLTGGAGFIGSNVLTHMVNTYPNTKVVLLDCLSYCSSTNNFKSVLNKPNFVFVKGDVCSPDLVNCIFEEYKIDTVLHFAAETHVDNSFGNSVNFSNTNVYGTHVLLEAARACKDRIRKFIHVSTDEVYGESAEEDERNTVDCVLNPTNPYAATKAAAEFLVKAYRYSYDLPIIITRGNNVYGPRQYPEKLIPKFIMLISQGKTCPLHGDGSNKRSYLHVDDVVRAFDCILTKGKVGEVYNIGSNYEITNKDTLMILLDTFDIKEKQKYTKYVSDRSYNDFRYHIDTLALEALGWQQQITFKEGLRTTKEWYLSHPKWWVNVQNALKAHPLRESVQFTIPQQRSSKAGQRALKRQKTGEESSECSASDSDTHEPSASP